MALFRAVWLSQQLSGLHVSEVGYLLLADLPVLGVLGLLAFGEAVASRRWKPVPVALTIVLAAMYLLDVVAVCVLNARLQLSDITLFGREWWLSRSYIRASSLVLLLIAVAALFLRPVVRGRIAGLLPGIAVVVLLLPLAVPDGMIPSHLHKYTGSILLLGKELWGLRGQPVTRYRANDVAAYRDEYDALFDAPFARTGRDIVMVIVESLSAADSARTSGIRNALPQLDRLSEEGMLFRNFFANFEASEGGIVSLVSGVPPVHFPTASTNTFAEYAVQRSISKSFEKAGYRSEFLTSVPLQFVSMDKYVKSPFVGFASAMGQREIERFRDAPRYAFESPADHVLYQELLDRLDRRETTRRQPRFMVVVTASSHAPYVDPRGQANTESNAWSYVQDELSWLYGELSARRFFDNGLLIITGDHRKMTPIREPERKTFGDSAKARIPLIIIGAGVPRGVIDERMFQQSDLLRMLDRALRPDATLSPFVVWVERYVFVHGVASNASNLQVFDVDNDGRIAVPLNVRGASIEWSRRPTNGFAVERALHRQRAMQQAVRAVRVGQTSLNFGRELEPSRNAHGVVVGFSTDLDLSRDPDDPKGSLKTFTADTFDLPEVISRVGGWADPFTLTVRAFVPIPEDGDYWFSVYADDASCLAIDKQIVLDCQLGINEGVASLTAGLHRFDLRFMDRGNKRSLDLKWLPPRAKAFVPFQHGVLISPD